MSNIVRNDLPALRNDAPPKLVGALERFEQQCPPSMRRVLMSVTGTTTRCVASTGA